LRNGSSAAGGAGSEILYCNHIVYVFGTDLQWWKWINGWSSAGSIDPCGGPTPTPTPTPTPSSVLLEDDFNDNSLNFAKWQLNNLFSGFTDATVATSETGQRLQIGPLFAGQPGSHYNGIRSASSYNLSGAYAYVELIQAPSAATKADAMFTIGIDAHNYYRIYVEEGALVCQARIAGTKRNLFTSAFNSVSHRYWRIRHDSATGNVVFETASDNGGVPGTWVARYSETWDTASVPIGVVMFELKGGTWQSEPSAPGVVIFDNFRAVRP
jgi:hypothetical protein